MKRNAFLAVLMVLLMVFTLALPSIACAEAADPTLVTIANGALQGYEDAERSLYIWLGVPYGEAPVGELRWMMSFSLSSKLIICTGSAEFVNGTYAPFT